MSFQNKYKVIVIEDSNIDLEIIKSTLQNKFENIEVISIKDGIKAKDYLDDIEKGNERIPHLILLDLGIPGINGNELLQKIKESEKSRMIPVIILSLSDYSKDILNSYSHYANCYITKPNDTADFVKNINIISNFWLNIVKLPRTVETY